MTKTKTTPHGGSSSHQPRGIATAMFTSAEGEAEQQFKDAPGEETEDSQDWPDWKEGASKSGGKTGDQPGTSKSEGKTGDQPKQAEGGAKVPPKENPPPPDPQPGTSKDPTDAPAEVPNQDLTEENPKNQRRKPHPFSLIM